MIKYVKGNIFNSECAVLVNPVNCVGVMGKGLALEFKNRYPAMFQIYKNACHTKELLPGRPMFVKGPNKSVILFPTKYHWKEKSKIIYIKDGLEAVSHYYKSFDIKSIAFPKLGCGLGGLSWEKVKPLMEQYLSMLDIDVEIYV